MVGSDTDVFLQLQIDCLNVILPMIAPYLKNYFGPKLWQNSTAGVQATLVRGAGEWSDCQPDCPSPRFSPHKTRSTSQASHFIFPVASPSLNSGRLHCLRYGPHGLEEQINDLPASQPAILLFSDSASQDPNPWSSLAHLITSAGPCLPIPLLQNPTAQVQTTPMGKQVQTTVVREAGHASQKNRDPRLHQRSS